MAVSSLELVGIYSLCVHQHDISISEILYLDDLPIKASAMDPAYDASG